MILTDSTEITSTEDLRQAFIADGIRLGNNLIVLNLETLITLENVYLTYYFETDIRLEELNELERLHKYACELCAQ